MHMKAFEAERYEKEPSTAQRQPLRHAAGPSGGGWWSAAEGEAWSAAEGEAIAGAAVAAGCRAHIREAVSRRRPALLAAMPMAMALSPKT